MAYFTPSFTAYFMLFISLSQKRSYNLEEALQKFFEPGTDSEIEELKESDAEYDTSSNTVTTLLLVTELVTT